MPPTKTSPTYNLGAILRETGLKADTLRAWERRYNLPQPSRSEGGQRLYSQRDLAIIKWLISKQEEGLRISQAVEMWRTQIADGDDPLIEKTSIESNQILFSPDGGNIAEYKSQWVAACASFNEARAEQIIAEAFSQYSPENVCFDILFSGLAEIGEAWYRGEVSVQQEHFTSALVTRRLNALIAGTPPPIHAERIVIASPSDEIHIIPSLLLTFLLRRRGWDVVFLGADVPLDNFRVTIKTLQPKLVILISHQLFTAASLLDLFNCIEGLQINVAFGGLIFTQILNLSNHMPGYYLGKNLKNAVPKIEELLHNQPKRLEARLSKQPKLTKSFLALLPAIENQVYEATDSYPEMQGINIHYFSRDILAALKLGDISFTSNNLDWVNGLLANTNVPAATLSSFLKIYAQAVEVVMGSQGAHVLDWLQNEISRIAEDEL